MDEPHGTQERSQSRRRWSALGVALAMALAATGLWMVLGPGRIETPAVPIVRASKTGSVPVLGTLPGFALIERSGRPVTLETLRGSVWVTTFFFSRCRDSCQLQNSRLAGLQGDLADVSDVRLVSISVDPEHDTPAVLRRYAAGFGADPQRWLFLTGDVASVMRLAQESFRLSVTAGPLRGASGTAPVLVHSPSLVLVDRDGRVRGYYDSGDPADAGRLRRDLEHVRGEAAG